MRPITRTTICALAAAAMAAPAVAASNYYLKLDNPKGESAAKAGGGTQIEILSWSWGATNAGGVRVATGDVNGDGKADVVTAPRDSASGMPTEKRQHGWVTISKPLDRGSVRVKVKLPWLDCKVGTAFPNAVLQNDAGRYELKEVLVSSCAPDSVDLDYASYRESPTRQSQK